jgi:hypothetical protein
MRYRLKSRGTPRGEEHITARYPVWNEEVIEVWGSVMRATLASHYNKGIRQRKKIVIEGEAGDR